jgi:hypothetical protein
MRRSRLREKAEALLKQVTAKPDDFARLAKGELPGPRLGREGRGFRPVARWSRSSRKQLWPEERGRNSGVVQSDFGFHIIR